MTIAATRPVLPPAAGALQALACRAGPCDAVAPPRSAANGVHQGKPSSAQKLASATCVTTCLLLAARRVAVSGRRQRLTSRRAEPPRLPIRPRGKHVDPDAFTALDIEEPKRQMISAREVKEQDDSIVKGASAWKGGAGREVKAKRSLSKDDDDAITAMDFEEQSSMSAHQMMKGDRKLSSVKEAIAKVANEEVDEETLARLVEMAPEARADLIDGMTRKAFLLMDAGDFKEAKVFLDRAGAIGLAFQRLTLVAEGKPIPPPRPSEKVQSEAEILAAMRRDLHHEDFVGIFGAQAKWAHFIGGF
ncbi:unnamed protein product [Polarella glacialis]|uniref:Uncharacterized protein n=1 Tax=Polarella glacialis TaxID=89957 RepID=A0A813IBZ5_POLGL|nr:unnamed protein product [Polarella glacialis]